jgi:hypothetical protein
MTNYPKQIDNSISLPPAVDLLTPVQGIVVNRLRDAIIAIESTLGTNPNIPYTTVAARLGTLETTLGTLGVINLAGDLGNTLATPHVIGMQGRPVSSAVPNLGDALTWNGLAWVPAAPPGGASTVAGGDLSGVYPIPKVVKIQGTSVTSIAPGATQDGYVLTWVNAAGQIEFKPAAIGFTAGGDLSGTNTNQTVVKLQGNSVSSAALGAAQDGYQLTWVNGSSQWQAKPDAVGFTAGGDLAGTATSQQVISLTGSGGSVILTPTSHIDIGTGTMATSGDIRIGSNGGSIHGMNSGLVVDCPLFQWDGANSIIIGPPTFSGVSGVGIYAGSLIYLYVGPGQEYFDAAGVNFRGGSHTSKVKFDFTSEVSPFFEWAGSGQTPATAGDFRTGNAFTLQSNNYNNTANASLLNWIGGSGDYIVGDPTVVNAITYRAVSSQQLEAPIIRFAITATGPALTFNIIPAGATSISIVNTATSFEISQADKTTASGVGAATTIQAQNEIGATSTGGNLVLKPGTGTSTNGAVLLGVGTVATTGTLRVANDFNLVARHALGAPSDIPLITFTDDVSYPSTIIGDAQIINLFITALNTINLSAPGARIILGSAQTWIGSTTAATPAIVITPNAVGATTITLDAGVTAFTLSQATHATVAHPFTIQAGNVTTGTGSDLILSSGSGSIQPGDLLFELGGSERAKVSKADYLLWVGSAGEATTRIGPMPGAAASYACLWVLPYATASTAVNMIMYSDGSGAFFNTPTAAGTIHFVDAGATFIAHLATASGFRFSNNGTQVAQIYQEDHATTPHALTIQAQNVTTGTGSNLDLTSGTGSVAAGEIHLKTGGVTRLTAKADGYVSVANLGAGTVLSDASGNLSSSTSPAVQNGGSPWKHLIITPFAGTTNTASGTYVVAGTFELDTTELTVANGTRTIKLRCIGETTSPQMSIKLYNLTAAADVTGSTLTTSSTVPVALTTGDLTANLTNGYAMYQVQILMAAGVPADQVILDMANIRVDWV